MADQSHSRTAEKCDENDITVFCAIRIESRIAPEAVARVTSSIEGEWVIAVVGVVAPLHQWHLIFGHRNLDGLVVPEFRQWP